jgi:hypothetical protein
LKHELPQMLAGQNGCENSCGFAFKSKSVRGVGSYERIFVAQVAFAHP